MRIFQHKGVFKGGVQGVQTPPEIFRFFLKSEGKEIEEKGMWGGGGYLLTYFWGLIFFRVRLGYFQGGLRNFRGGLGNFRGGGLRNFRGGGLRNFRGGLRNFRGGVEKFSGGGVGNFWGRGLRIFFGGGLRNFRGVKIITGDVKFFR